MGSDIPNTHVTLYKQIVKRVTEALVLLPQVSGLHSPAVSSPQNGAQDSVLGNGSVLALSSLPGEGQSGGRMDRSASYQLTSDEDSMSRERSHHTLADLKRQRAAAKLQKHPAALLPASADPRDNEPVTEESPASEQRDAVYFTPSSGDPPLLKLRAPEEEDTSNSKEPCCGLM